MSQAEDCYCVQCGGRTAPVSRPYAVERGGQLVVIRDVPMHDCDRCADTYMTTAVMRQLDELIAGLLASRADEAIVRYPAVA